MKVKDKLRECSWCGKPGAELNRIDAGGALHYFHKKCAIDKDYVLNEKKHNGDRRGGKK